MLEPSDCVFSLAPLDCSAVIDPEASRSLINSVAVSVFPSDCCNKDNNLRWPNTVFARALADAIQRAHKDCKNKHAVDTAIILFAQCPLYLCYFSS